MRYNEIMLRKILATLVLLVVFFVSSRQLFLGKLFFLHDFTHAARIAEMTRGLQDGDFPVQWSKNFGYGYGMPLFLFYGPLPFYFGAGIYILSGSIIWSVLTLFILANLVTIGGTYVLGKTLVGKMGGVILTTLYVLAPYRAVNLFVRGALNELWAMAFLPWLILGWFWLIKKNKLGGLMITTSTAAIILSHNLSAIYYLPFALLISVALFFWLIDVAKIKHQALFAVIARGLLSTGLGIGLSAFYALPAMIEKSFTRLDLQVLTGYFDFHNHFLYLRQFLIDNWTYGGSAWGPEDGISFFLGYGLLFGLFVGFVLLVSRQLLLKKKNQLVAISILFLLVSGLILLTTEKTLWIWEHLTILKYLQFPWRLLSLITFGLALIVTLVTSWSFKRKRFVVLALIFVTLVSSYRYFSPADYYQDSIGPFQYDEKQIQTNMSGILPDYLPNTFNVAIAPFKNILTETDLVKAEVLKDGNSEKLISLEVKQEMALEISLANFPGWKAYLDGKEAVTTTTNDGLLSIQLPSGKHLLSLAFESTSIRRIGYLMSCGSLVLILVGQFIIQHKSLHPKLL